MHRKGVTFEARNHVTNMVDSRVFQLSSFRRDRFARLNQSRVDQLPVDLKHFHCTKLNMPIHIYTEHLLNIRTLTIQISLPTDSDESTAISADGDVFTLSHQGEFKNVTLPVSIPDAERAKISVPPAPNRNLSFRVKLGDDLPRDSQSSETTIPWTAASLSQQTQFQCKGCNAVILPQGAVQTWKDLPSEGWAEMMEFWHCHKPNEPHDHEHQTDKKGYSADSMLAITASVGLVNATSFVLAAVDCQNIKVGHKIHSLSLLEDLTTWALKNRRFPAARLSQMEDSGYRCPRTNPSYRNAEPAATLAKAMGSLAKQCSSFLRTHRHVVELIGVAYISA
jgi:hypothetical protein